MKYKNSKEEIELAIVASNSWAEACRRLDRKDRTGNQAHLKKKAISLNIDFSHFKGRAWSRGLKNLIKTDINLYLSNTKKINSHNLRNRLIKEGIKKRECEVCSLSKWNGEDIVLELDHKDSNHYNNSLDNLQILCPNCHAQETRKRINSKKYKPFDKRKISKPKLNLRKVQRPDIEQLKIDIDLLGYSATGRKYGVSDNSIRKWLKWEAAGTVDNSVLETEAK